MKSANSDSFIYCFPIRFHLFIYLYCLIVLARTSNNSLNKTGESGYPCHVPDFRGNAFSFSPLSMMLAVGLSYMAFIMLRYVPSILILLRILAINGC